MDQVDVDITLVISNDRCQSEATGESNQAFFRSPGSGLNGKVMVGVGKYLVGPSRGDAA